MQIYALTCAFYSHLKPIKALDKEFQHTVEFPPLYPGSLSRTQESSQCDKQAFESHIFYPVFYHRPHFPKSTPKNINNKEIKHRSIWHDKRSQLLYKQKVHSSPGLGFLLFSPTQSPRTMFVFFLFQKEWSTIMNKMCLYMYF